MPFFRNHTNGLIATLYTAATGRPYLTTGGGWTPGADIAAVFDIAGTPDDVLLTAPASTLHWLARRVTAQGTLQGKLPVTRRMLTHPDELLEILRVFDISASQAADIDGNWDAVLTEARAVTAELAAARKEYL